jgi:hypothetical protein
LSNLFAHPPEKRLNSYFDTSWMMQFKPALKVLNQKLTSCSAPTLSRFSSPPKADFRPA